MKAKRSLTNSFDHLMKRKGSRDDFSLGLHSRDSTPQFNSPTSSQKDDNQSPVSSMASGLDSCQESGRPRSLRVSPEQQLSVNTGPKSPMMDMWVKIVSPLSLVACTEHRTIFLHITVFHSSIQILEGRQFPKNVTNRIWREQQTAIQRILETGDIKPCCDTWKGSRHEGQR